MPRVRVVFWMAQDYGDDFIPLSPIRSFLQADVENGSTVQALFSQLAKRYDHIGKQVFCGQTGTFLSDIVVLLNDRLIGTREIYERVLQEGDSVAILPLYVGG